MQQSQHCHNKEGIIGYAVVLPRAHLRCIKEVFAVLCTAYVWAEGEACREGNQFGMTVCETNCSRPRKTKRETCSQSTTELCFYLVVIATTKHVGYTGIYRGRLLIWLFTLLLFSSYSGLNYVIGPAVCSVGLTCDEGPFITLVNYPLCSCKETWQRVIGNWPLRCETAEIRVDSSYTTTVRLNRPLNPRDIQPMATVRLGRHNSQLLMH